MQIKNVAAILTLASLAAAATARTSTPPPTPPQPKAVVPAPIHDFGVIEKTAKVRHGFEIRNEGTAPLLLREARPDCACAVVSFDSSVPPGGTGTVRAELDPADQLGAIRKVILVFTNDPAAPELQLTLTAEVKPVLLMKPGYARYIYVQKEVPAAVTQTLWAADGRDFEVLEVKSPYPYLKATFEEVKPAARAADKRGKQWTISTTLDPASPVGALTEPVLIVTDHPLQKELELKVSGFVRPVVALTPTSIDFGDVPRSSEKKGAVAFKSYSTEPIVLTGAEITLPGATTRIETITEGRYYLVHLVLPAGMPKGPFSGKLKMTTASPKAPSVELLFQGLAVD